MKKALLFVFTAFALTAVLVSFTDCSKKPVKPSVITVTEASLNKTTLSLTVEGKETLTVTITPADATDKSVTWSSDNTAIATVNSTTGEVTAVAVGEAEIKATTVGGRKTASCTVTVTAATVAVTRVTPNKVAVTGVTLNKTATSLILAAAPETLVATVAPANATNKNVTWSSDNTAVAIVSSTTGTVYSIALGTAKITATTVSGSKTASCTVTVTEVTVDVTGVTLNKTATSLGVGAKETLSATVAPTNATNKNVTWSSDNTAVATVNSSTGEVIAVSLGTAKITATTVSGSKTASCTVTVIIEASGITLNKTATSLALGAKETLVAILAPSNATEDVIWSSDRPSIATVNSSTGEVTAAEPGLANITATTVRGRKTASCAVTVIRLDVSPTSLNFAAVGGEEWVGINSNTTWTASSNAAWLTLDRTSGNGNGNLRLTAAATTVDSPRTATVTIRAGSITKSVAITQETNIIRITNAAQLLQINNNTSGHYSLRNNITVTNWIPIGSENSGSDGLFTGTFDGNGYTITINSFGPVTLRGYYNYGLFSHIRNGKVSRLHVAINAGAVNHTNADINYGGIAGIIDNGSLIENCSVSGNLRAVGSNSYVTYVGGIGGYVSGTTIRNCLTTGSISVTGTYSGLVGGIAGRFGGEMRACVAMQSSITDNSTINTSRIGRVVGDLNGILNTMANYANANMTVRGSKVTSGTGEVTKNGADCTTATSGPTGWGGLTFWQGTLGWNNTIWDFSGISAAVLPKLKMKI